jgi:hypothetical protein
MHETGCSPQPRSPKFEDASKSSLITSLRSQGNCHSRSLSLSLTDWHKHPRPGRFANATHEWPNSMVFEHGAHPRHPYARPSGSGYSATSLWPRPRPLWSFLIGLLKPGITLHSKPPQLRSFSRDSPGTGPVTRKLALTSSRPGGREYYSSSTSGPRSLLPSKLYGRLQQIWTLPRRLQRCAPYFKRISCLHFSRLWLQVGTVR